MTTTDDAVPLDPDGTDPSGGRTIVLDDPAVQFHIGSGRAVLFAVRGTAARRQIGAIEAGGILFGAEPSFLGDERIVAVLDRQASVLPVPAGVWGIAEAVELLVPGAARWLETLAAGLGPSMSTPPGPVQPARLGVSRLAAGATLTGGSAPVWLALPAGGALLFGVEPVSGLVPLPPGAYVTLEEAGEVEVLSMHAGLAQPSAINGVLAFTQAACELLPIARGFAETDEHHRLTLRGLAHQRDRDVIAERLGGLVRGRPASAARGDEALPAVLRHFETVAGFRVRLPTRARRAQMDVPPTLAEICRASDIQLQRVTLKSGWWTQEGGPFLGWRKSDGAPVALIWRRGAFKEIDASGRWVRVDGPRAASIDVKAQIPFAGLPAKTDVLTLFRRTLHDGRGDVWAFLLSIVIGAAIAQIAPIAIGFIFGVLVPAALDGALVQVAIAMSIIGVAGFVMTVVGARSRLAMDAREDARLFREGWDKLLAQPLARFRLFSIIDLTRQVSSLVLYQSAVRQFSATVARLIGFGGGSLLVIATGGGLVALVAIGAMLVHLGIAYVLARMQVDAIMTGEALLGSSENQMLQIVNGLPTLRAAGAEARAVNNWAHRFVAMRARLVKSRRVANLFETWATAFPVLATAALFASLPTTGEDGGGGFPTASALSVITAFGILMGTTSQFARALVGFITQGPTLKMAEPLLDQSIQPPADLVDPGSITGEFEFSSVSFQYPNGQRVLQDVSFKVRPGEMVAVVGSSGGGKSTLIRLLLGLERPSGGAVYLDGHDVATLHPVAMRQRIAVVTQNERLPPGTILDIVRGQGDADPVDVWRALADAAMAEDVAAMPMELHTLLQDAGRTLSGGQIQRIALARAFLANPRLLILDEATSALDGRTQEKVLDTMGQSSATRFVIAHRLSTVRQADRILVLEGGRVVETGSYGELMAANGVFAALAET